MCGHAGSFFCFVFSAGAQTAPQPHNPAFIFIFTSRFYFYDQPKDETFENLTRRGPPKDFHLLRHVPKLLPLERIRLGITPPKIHIICTLRNILAIATAVSEDMLRCPSDKNWRTQPGSLDLSRKSARGIVSHKNHSRQF